MIDTFSPQLKIAYFDFFSQKIKRSIGMKSKIRHFVDTNVLIFISVSLYFHLNFNLCNVSNFFHQVLNKKSVIVRRNVGIWMLYVYAMCKITFCKKIPARGRSSNHSQILAESQELHSFNVDLSFKLVDYHCFH